MAHTYFTGQTPKVGDHIEIHDTSGLDYYSQVKKDKVGTVYVVSEVINNNVKIRRKGENFNLSTYKPARFRLVYRSDEAVEKVNSVLIVDGVYTVVARTFEHKVNEVLESLLMKNPTQTYHVFGYRTTAKIKKPEITFTNLMGEGRVDPVVLPDRILPQTEQPKLFSKK